MDKIITPVFRAAVVMTAMFYILLAQIVEPARVLAETAEVQQSNASVFREASLQSEGLKQEPVIFTAKYPDYKTISVAEIKIAIQKFLDALPHSIENGSNGSSVEYEALCQTLSNFLKAEQFEKTVERALIRKEPVQLAYMVPQKTKDANMVNDLSPSFGFPLQFQSTSEIVTYAVTLSFARPSYGLAIRIETTDNEALYVLDPGNGAVFKRFGPALA